MRQWFAYDQERDGRRALHGALDDSYTVDRWLVDGCNTAGKRPSPILPASVAVVFLSVLWSLIIDVAVLQAWMAGAGLAAPNLALGASVGHVAQTMIAFSRRHRSGTPQE